MARRDKKRREMLLRRGEHEDRVLRRKAARLRKASEQDERRPRRKGRHALEEEPRFEKRRRRRGGSLDRWVEELRVEDLGDEVGEGARSAGNEQATVVAVASGRCRVLLDEDVECDCLLAPEIASAQRTDLAVGDRVSIARRPEAAMPRVEGVLPRATTLSRLDPGPGRPIERVIAANVDAALVVVSAQRPALRLRLLDRYLIAIERGDVRPIVGLAKMDLVGAQEEQELLARLQPYRELGLPVVPCSTVSGRGLGELRAELAGKRCVLVGQSGVGKSSLLNALEPGLALSTSEVSEAVGKGRHTTTSSRLLRLADGIRVIDTPGIREFGLWDLGPEELRWYFHEFDEPAARCRFADCSHLHEPDCAVRDAVAAGAIAEARYESYRRLAGSAS